MWVGIDKGDIVYHMKVGIVHYMKVGFDKEDIVYILPIWLGIDNGDIVID